MNSFRMWSSRIMRPMGLAMTVAGAALMVLWVMTSAWAMAMGTANFYSTGAHARAATITVTLFSDELDWHGEAGTPVHGFVLNDGLLVASAYRTISDSTGRAALRFSRSSGYQGPPRAGHLLPTDKVVLIAAGHMPMTVTLPAVSADFDAMRDRVGGEAPPNSAAHLTLRDASSGATRMDSEVTVGTSGRFSVDAGPGVDLLHSDLGEIVFTDTGGNHIRSRIVAPTVDVVVGWPVKCFRQRGEAHNVEIRDAVGNVVESGCTGPRARPVEVGDLVTLYLGPDFMVPGAPPTVSLRVPSLSLRRDPSSQSLLGGGPPNQRLVVTVGSSFRAEDRQVVQTNERGQFTVTAPDDPGTSVTIHMDGLNGITVEKRVNLVSVFVGLNNMGVAARAGSIGEDLPIDLTLIDPQGDIKADVSLSGQVGWREKAWSGDWNQIFFGQANGAAAQQGDSLEVQIDEEDPITLDVPLMMVRVDATGDVIAGTVPPDSQVLVTFAGGGSATEVVRPPLRTRADASGNFRVDLAGTVDLGPGMWGLVLVWKEDSPVSFYSVWSVQRLQLNLPNGALQGNGALSETLKVELRDADGHLKYVDEVTNRGLLSLTAESMPRKATWDLGLGVDPLTGAHDIKAGDVVTVHGQSADTRLVVPTTDITADPVTDQISGRVPPGHGLQITIRTRAIQGNPRDGTSFSEPVPVRPDGQFNLSLAPSFDLWGGDSIEAAVTTPEGHVVLETIVLPYFDVNLNNGWLSGAFFPPKVGLPVTATLRRNAIEVARSNGESTFGTFLVALLDAAGAPAVPGPGDEIDIEIGTAVRTHLSMRVPDLVAEMDWKRARLRGHSQSPGALIFSGPGNVAAYPVPGSDGSFDVEVDRPGSTVPWAYPGNGGVLTMYLPSGNSVERSFAFPRLSVELGGARIDGLVSPLANASAELVDAQGRVVARAEGRAKAYRSEGFDGDDTDNLFLTLTDRSGPVRTEAGQLLRATIDGTAVEIPLPELRTEVDWAAGTLSGQGPAGSEFSFALQGDRTCRPETGFSWEKPADPRFWRSGSPLRHDQDGQFSLAPLQAPPGKRVMIGMRTPSGHHVYRTIQRPSVEINTQSGTVAGCSQPLSTVTAELLDEGARSRSKVDVSADAAGHYNLSFQDQGGQPVAIRPTDVLRVCAIGDCATLEVKPLTVDFDGSSGVKGSVVPDRPAWLRVTPRFPFSTRPSYPQLTGGLLRWWYPVVYKLRPDPAGKFQLADTDLPKDFRPWPMSDIESLKIWSEIEEGRYLVTELAAYNSTFLPFALR